MQRQPYNARQHAIEAWRAYRIAVEGHYPLAAISAWGRFCEAYCALTGDYPSARWPRANDRRRRELYGVAYAH